MAKNRLYLWGNPICMGNGSGKIYAPVAVKVKDVRATAASTLSKGASWPVANVLKPNMELK